MNILLCGTREFCHEAKAFLLLQMNAKINLGYRESTDLWVEADEDTFDKAVALVSITE